MSIFMIDAIACFFACCIGTFIGALLFSAYFKYLISRRTKK